MQSRMRTHAPYGIEAAARTRETVANVKWMKLDYILCKRHSYVLQELEVKKIRRAVSYEKCRCCGKVNVGGGVLQGLFLTRGASDPILRWFGYRHSSTLDVCFPFPRFTQNWSYTFLFRPLWNTSQSNNLSTYQWTSLLLGIYTRYL